MIKDDFVGLFAEVKRIAVLGMKTEAQADQPAFYVPKYMIEAGFDVVPVPVYYANVTEILGRKVYRRVADVPPPVDLVNVFRRSEDLAPHFDDIVAAKPKWVWLQVDIHDSDFEARLEAAGIRVIADACIMVAHRLYVRK